MTNTYGIGGIVLDSVAEIISDYHAKAKLAWDESVYLGEDEYLGHFYALVGTTLGEINQVLQSVWDGFSVANSSGTQLDRILEVVWVFRQQAAKSTVQQLQFTAVKPTTVAALSKVKTAANVIWETTEEIVFAAAGTSTVPARCTVNGANDAAIGDINALVNSIYGISAVTNLDAAIPGRFRETDETLKKRHTAVVATAGLDAAAVVLNEVSSVSGVDSTYVFDNDTDAAVDGVPAGNLHVSVIGGADADIAAAIADKKGVGVPTYGSTTVSVYNSTTKQAKDINFSRAANVPIYVTLTVADVDGVFPSDGAQQLKEALVAHIDEFEINDDVVYTELYKPIYSIPGHFVTTLYTGIAPSPSGIVTLSMTALQRATLDITNVSVTVL